MRPAHRGRTPTRSICPPRTPVPAQHRHMRSLRRNLLATSMRRPPRSATYQESTRIAARWPLSDSIVRPGNLGPADHKGIGTHPRSPASGCRRNMCPCISARPEILRRVRDSAGRSRPRGTRLAFIRDRPLGSFASFTPRRRRIGDRHTARLVPCPQPRPVGLTLLPLRAQVLPRIARCSRRGQIGHVRKISRLVRRPDPE